MTFVAFVAAAMLLGALASQYVWGLKPCPLCGRTMRRGLIQSGGVLYFTDEEKYWINWPLKSRGDIPLLGGKLFPTFPDDGATKLAQICTDCEVVLFYYGKKWDDRRWNR